MFNVLAKKPGVFAAISNKESDITMTDKFYKNERFFIKLERLAPTNIFRV